MDKQTNKHTNTQVRADSKRQNFLGIYYINKVLYNNNVNRFANNVVGILTVGTWWRYYILITLVVGILINGTELYISTKRTFVLAKEESNH